MRVKSDFYMADELSRISVNDFADCEDCLIEGCKLTAYDGVGLDIGTWRNIR